MSTPAPFLRGIMFTSIFACSFLASTRGEAGEFIRGDVNQDGTVDLSDAIGALSYLFIGDRGVDCLQAADIDDSGSIDITDVFAVLSYRFLGGAAPPAPFPTCGDDPTPGSLDCRSFSACGGGQSVKVIGRTVTSTHSPLAAIDVDVEGVSTVSGVNGGFVAELAILPGVIHITATNGAGLSGSKDVAAPPVPPGVVVDFVDAGDVVLVGPPPDDCENVVGRAADRGCGRVFAWGDEHVTFDSYLPDTEMFWSNALSWLAQPTCDGFGSRTRIGNYRGFQVGVKALLESQGYLVTDLDSPADMSEVDILVAGTPSSGDQLFDVLAWVQAGGALMSLVPGIGDRSKDDCVAGNRLISSLGLSYDCTHAAPAGPVTAFGDHPIAQGLSSQNAPFVGGRWVIDVPGSSSEVVARVGDDCSPAVVPDCSHPAGFEPDPPPGGNVEVLSDCGNDYNQDTDDVPGTPELHIIGISEAKMGRVTVNVNRTDPMVLVLSSYSSVQWNVVPGVGTNIVEVIAASYEGSSVLAPPGLQWEIAKFQTVGYGNDCGGGDTPGLIHAAQSLTGLTMRSFHGCYQASEFTFVGDSPGPEPGLTVVGRVVDQFGEPVARTRVVSGAQEDFSGLAGDFVLRNVTPAPSLTINASRGALVGRRDLTVDPGSVDPIDAGNIVLTPLDPPDDPNPDCSNVVGRAVVRNCGRVFVWGDEHVRFDSYLKDSEAFWHNAMDWLSDSTYCEFPLRTRVGNFQGVFSTGVRAIIEARGMTVVDINSFQELDQVDIVVAQAFSQGIPGSELIKDWVEAGGALMTLIIGVGDSFSAECDWGNEMLAGLGIAYDCSRPAPWGPVTSFGNHPIAAGLTPANAPFVNGRWVVDQVGDSAVVARAGEACDP